jgi:hypothetical protein
MAELETSRQFHEDLMQEVQKQLGELAMLRQLVGIRRDRYAKDREVTRAVASLLEEEEKYAGGGGVGSVSPSFAAPYASAASARGGGVGGGDRGLAAGLAASSAAGSGLPSFASSVSPPRPVQLQSILQQPVSRVVVESMAGQRSSAAGGVGVGSSPALRLRGDSGVGSDIAGGASIATYSDVDTRAYSAAARARVSSLDSGGSGGAGGVGGARAGSAGSRSVASVGAAPVSVAPAGVAAKGDAASVAGNGNGEGDAVPAWVKDDVSSMVARHHDAVGPLVRTGGAGANVGASAASRRSSQGSRAGSPPRSAVQSIASAVSAAASASAAATAPLPPALFSQQQQQQQQRDDFQRPEQGMRADAVDLHRFAPLTYPEKPVASASPASTSRGGQRSMGSSLTNVASRARRLQQSAGRHKAFTPVYIPFGGVRDGIPTRVPFDDASYDFVNDDTDALFVAATAPLDTGDGRSDDGRSVGRRSVAGSVSRRSGAGSVDGRDHRSASRAGSPHEPSDLRSSDRPHSRGSVHDELPLLHEGFLTKCNKNKRFWRRRFVRLASPRLTALRCVALSCLLLACRGVTCARCRLPRRWCMLNDSMLTYYARKEDALRDKVDYSAARGVVDLTNAFMLLGPGERSTLAPESADLCFRIVADNRTYFFCADVSGALD